MLSMATHYASLKNGSVPSFFKGYANQLISIYMNINFRNERKIVEKLRGVSSNLPISHLPCVLVYQTWYTFFVET